MQMDRVTRMVRERLEVIQLAKSIGSVREACSRYGISRTQFYEYKRRFETDGIEGLKRLPTVHKSHPQTTAPAMVECVLALSLKNPLWGCIRLSKQVKRLGISISSPTVQKILLSCNLGSISLRLLRLEEMALNGEIELNKELAEAIEQANPSFKERLSESSCPGELLGQDTLYVGCASGIGKIYLQAVVDTYNSYAFAYLHAGKHSAHAAAVLQNRVMPQYEEWQLLVSAILTDNCREYCGRVNHPYESYLALNDIEHLTTKNRKSASNGFVERFKCTLREEFLWPSLSRKACHSIEQLQEELDGWLIQYNEQRPNRGYRNRGKPPIHLLREYLENFMGGFRES